MRPLRTGLLWAALLAGCTSTEAPLDPSLAPLPTLEEVDDRFARHIVGPDMRQRALYEADSPVKGAAEPLVTIVEYSDFQCPFCGRFAATLDELLVAYPDDVRIVFMQFPLPMHPKAEGAAKAAIAAGQQRRFWAMHDRLFRSSAQLDRETLVRHARELGLDVPAFEAAMDSPETEKRLLLEKTVGARLGVRGTPAFFINGLGHTGAVEPDALYKVIEQERANAKELIEAGVPRRELYAHIMRAARPAGAPAPFPAR